MCLRAQSAPAGDQEREEHGRESSERLISSESIQHYLCSCAPNFHPQNEIAPPPASESDVRHLGLADDALVMRAAPAIFYRK